MCIEYYNYLLETVSEPRICGHVTATQGDTLQIKPGYKGLVRCVFNTIRPPRKDIRAKQALEVFGWKGEIPVTCTVLHNDVLSVPTFPDVLSTKRSGYEIRDSHVASRYACLSFRASERIHYVVGKILILRIKIFRSWVSLRKKTTFPDATNRLFPRNDVWETSAEISHWWRVTT